MTVVYLLVRANHGKEGLVKASLSKLEEVEHIDEVFGRYDIIAVVQTKNTALFSKLMKNKIRIIEHIKSVEALFVAEQDDYSL